MTHTNIHKILLSVPKPTPCPHDAAALVINLLLLICFLLFDFFLICNTILFTALLIANNIDSKQCKSTVDIVNQVLQRWKECAIKDDRAQQVRQDTMIFLSCERLDLTFKETEMFWSKTEFESRISHIPTLTHPHPHNHTHTHTHTTTPALNFVALLSSFEINAK